LYGVEAYTKGNIKMIEYEKLYHMLIDRRKEMSRETAEYWMLTSMIDALAKYFKEMK
jgi:hypothetical protein